MPKFQFKVHEKEAQRCWPIPSFDLQWFKIVSNPDVKVAACLQVLGGILLPKVKRKAILFITENKKKIVLILTSVSYSGFHITWAKRKKYWHLAKYAIEQWRCKLRDIYKYVYFVCSAWWVIYTSFIKGSQCKNYENKKLCWL